MIAYLLKSATCLALLLAFYHFVLEKEKMHNFNRYYLLGSIVFSFLAPLYIIYIKVTPVILETTESIISYSPTNLSTSEIIYEEPMNYMQIFISIYLLISCVLLIRFGKNLYQIIHKIRKNTKIDFQKAKLILVDDKILPHTFWNYIFINKKDYENQKIEQELFTHELTHVTQKHTLDVLILELIQVVFWINPFFILLKKAIQLNHEFLADETVINQHKNTFQYQHLLLNKAAWKNEYYLASNLNYSLTKKRLEMMTTQSSKTKILLKKLAVIPLLVGFIFLFAERVEAQEKQEIIETVVEQPKNVQKSNKKLTKEQLYRDFTHQNSFMTIEKNGKKISKKYSEMSRSERDNLKTFSLSLKTKKKVPTQKLIEDLKDSKKYAIWIDEKVVSNATLNNYNASDFSNYFVSFVHKNARSKRFPQNYQASLSTNKHYENQNKKRAQAFKKYLKENTKSKEIIEIVEEKATTYSSKSSKQSISKTNASLFEIEPYKNINSGFKFINDKVFYFVSIDDKIKYYNKDGKLCNKNGKTLTIKKANASEIMPDIYVKNVYYKGNLFCEFIDDKPNLKELEKKNLTQQLKEVINTVDINSNQKFNKNWFITIKGQKYYYTFDKKERIARYYKNGKLVNLDIVKEYKKKHKIFEKLKASGKHYVFKPENDKKEIDREFSDLGGMYFRMPSAHKNKVPYPNNPIKPYVRLRKGDKIWYKKRSELTEEDKLLLPPPPPVPNATKEQIIEARRAYNEWKKRMGNNLPPPPPPRKN